MSETMAALADRVEALDKPCRETDVAIALAVQPFPDALNLRIDPDDDAGWLIYEVIEDGDEIACCDKAESYTASLDAAMTLTTGFILCHLSEIGGDGLPMCVLGDPSTTPAGSWSGFSFGSGPLVEQLARAITAAALRARAAMEDTQ